MSRVLASAAAFAAPVAFAHPGHAAATASHWHATDVFGLVAMGVAAMAVIWFTRGGK